MQCVQCGSNHERKGIYCSKSCNDKAYRERKKLKLLKLSLTTGGTPVSEIEEPVSIPKEAGEKLKWCNFCGASIENSTMLGFCNSDHELDYWRAVHNNLPLKLRIDAKTIVETRRYYRVQEIIEAMLNRNKFGATFF
jgi:predicted nucleic acid-binding Zn ribbon protein